MVLADRGVGGGEAEPGGSVALAVVDGGGDRVGSEASFVVFERVPLSLDARELPAEAVRVSDGVPGELVEWLAEHGALPWSAVGEQEFAGGGCVGGCEVADFGD